LIESVSRAATDPAASTGVASVHDRKARVLATPRDPAGRIREDVFVIDEARVLGDRARPHDATTRMAFTVARSRRLT
jgi:hypothetical protein